MRGTGHLTAGEERVWREALERLRVLERAWQDEAERERERETCRLWLAEQRALPRLAGLARLLTPGLTPRQLDCARVPVERAVARLRITDVEILDADLPPGEEPSSPPLPLTVVADSIRSAFNVGGLFRTAECFGVRELLLCGYTPPPDQPQTARAALGTERLVAWRHAGEVREAIAELRAAGVPCVALETVSGAPSVGAFEWPLPCALVVGNERFGLDPDVVQACDAAVRIPLAGRKNSLNVVSALAVALFAATGGERKKEEGGVGRASVREER